MKITKYEHACLVVEEQGKKLVIDPGDFADSLPDLDNVTAIIITHVHFDHLNKDRVKKILEKNPEAKIFSTQEVKNELSVADVVKPGEKQSIGPIGLEFFGGQHAVTHPDYPKCENIGVLVNNKFYYGGDSLVGPDKPIEVLAVPISGPWSKTQEELDYMAKLKPQVAFPTHDALNSDVGNASQDRWFTTHSEKRGIEYKRLDVGESLEI